MIGVGELLLLLLAFVFAGGAVSKIAQWAFFRKTTGAKQILWALASWFQGRGSGAQSGGSERDTRFSRTGDSTAESGEPDPPARG